jgi:3-oxoacyl-[acyl-carrier-protein] synthase II
VVTGAGLLTPLGRGLEASWHHLSGRSGGPSRGPETDGPEWLRWAGRVAEPDLGSVLPRGLLSQVRFLNRGARLALVAARDALAGAGPLDAVPPERRALYLATGDLTTAGVDALHPATRVAATAHGVDREVLNRESVHRVNPFFLLETLANNPFSMLGAALDLTGPGTCLGSQSPSGALALDLAFRSVLRGRADLAVVVGSGSWIGDVPRLELAGLGLLSRCRDGARSFRPFDRRRDGFIVGEGAAALVLEGVGHARRRGAGILATVESTSACLEAAQGLGVADRVTARAMELALGDADRTPAELAFVCAHGSGTRKGDRAEAASLRAVLTRETTVPVCALKPHTGHMGAASDLAEIVLALLAARHGVVPATPNFERGDPDTVDLAVSPDPRPCAHPRFLSVSYGLGGAAAAAVVSLPVPGAGRG